MTSDELVSDVFVRSTRAQERNFQRADASDDEDRRRRKISGRQDWALRNRAL